MCLQIYTYIVLENSCFVNIKQEFFTLTHKYFTLTKKFSDVN